MPALTAVLTAAGLCRRTVPTLRSFSTSPATSYPRGKPQRIRVVSPTAKKVAADYFPVRVLPREQQDGTYKPPPPPPVSPLASDELFKPYHLKHPKAAPKKGTELTPREWALRQNPYGNRPLRSRELKLTENKNPAAQILASPVRTEVDFHRRLPSPFLLRFVLKLNPGTDNPWLLPDGLEIDARKQGVKGGLYSLATYRAMVAFHPPGQKRGRSVWAKLVPPLERHRIMNTVTWRSDMPDFVLRKLRARVVREMVGTASSKWVDRVEGGVERWEWAGEVMAVIDFRRSECPSRLKGKKKEGDNLGECWGGEQTPPMMDELGLLARVNGKSVPVHPLRFMLGEEMVAEVMYAWRCYDEEMVALMMTHRTVNMQIWLLRLRWYFENYYTPPLEGEAERVALQEMAG